MSEFLKKDEIENLDTVLSEDIRFKGTLSFKKPLMVQGQFTGDINATGDLYIAEKAVVEAQVEANNISIRGTVRGNVTGHSRVKLYSSSLVEGDITAPDIIMESGCRFNGICKMTGGKQHEINQ